MKAGSAIDIFEANDYKKEDLRTYQCFIGKLIYLVYRIRPDIVFAVDQLSKHNADSRKNLL